MNQKLKHLAHQIVNTISSTVLEEYKKHFFKLKKTVGLGADGTPTSYIDRIAEDVALDMLQKSNVKVNLLSEEVGFVDLGGKYVFILDPVDGTRNASRGIPFYSVSLAIGRSTLSDVEYGIVRNIPNGDIFVAEKKRGAFLNNRPIGVCEMPSADIVSSISLGKNYTSKAGLLSKKDNVRSLGAVSLEMCLVACGALDYFFVGKERMRVVDIAASTLIVREAGGFVKTITGDELDMELDLTQRVSVVAACSEELISRLVSVA